MADLSKNTDAHICKVDSGRCSLCGFEFVDDACEMVRLSPEEQAACDRKVVEAFGRNVALGVTYRSVKKSER